MKLLFMTVGTGRTGDDIAKGLFFSIEYHNPDRIFFFCSNQTAVKTMPHIKALIGDKYDYRTSIYENEDDVQYLYNAYIADMQVYKDVDNEIIVDFTSGTKAMSAAMFSAGIAVDADFVSYIVGERDTTGRVIISTGASSIKPSDVIARREIEKAKRLFNEMDYGAAFYLASKSARDLSESPLKQMAQTIAALSNAYRLWEQYKWQQACEEINGLIKTNHYLSDEQKENLAQSAHFCGNVANCHYGYQRLIDLEQNAARRMKQKRYDDALARLYRAIEYFIQVRFESQFAMELAQTKRDDFLALAATYPICEDTLRKIDIYFKRSNNGRLRLGLRDALELLAELGDQAGKFMIECYWDKNWHPGKIYNKPTRGILQNWLNERNQSYLGHGTKPIEPKTARKLAEFYSDLLVRFAGVDIDVEKLRQAATFIKL